MEFLLKRFLKYNRSLVAVIAGSLLIVLLLLVVAVAKYLEMVVANKEVNEMRDSIEELQDSRRNEVAVIAGNLDRLKEDYELYQKQNAAIRPYFGQPYANAVNVMALNMQFKSGDEFVRNFYDFLAKDTSESIYNRYKRFKMQNSARWAAAIAAFSKEAQKISFEKITAANEDDIFLQAIGLPREMSGRSQEYCSDIIRNIEIQLNKYVLDRNIDINKEAAAFSLTTPGLSTPARIADSMQNMEIIGDMIPRIIKSVPQDRSVKYMKVLDEIKFLGKNAYRDDPKINVYKYRLKFSVTIDALRDIIKNLNASIVDKRIYVLRDLKLKVKPVDDQAAIVIGLVEAPVLKDKDGKVIEIKYRDDSHLAYNLRRDYGKVLVGNNDYLDVEMEIDYMLLKPYEYNQR